MAGNWNRKRLILSITWSRMYNKYWGHNHGRNNSINDDDDDDDNDVIDW